MIKIMQISSLLCKLKICIKCHRALILLKSVFVHFWYNMRKQNEKRVKTTPFIDIFLSLVSSYLVPKNPFLCHAYIRICLTNTPLWQVISLVLIVQFQKFWYCWIRVIKHYPNILFLMCFLFHVKITWHTYYIY